MDQLSQNPDDSGVISKCAAILLGKARVRNEGLAGYALTARYPTGRGSDYSLGAGLRA